MALSILKRSWSWFSKPEVTEVAKTPEHYLRLTTKYMEQVERMTQVSTSALKFNHEQCMYIAEKLRKAVRSAHSFLELINTWHSPFASIEDRARSIEIFKLLFALGKEVVCFIQDCCKDALPFTISEGVHIMLQLAEGILYLHDKKIVHRDLKSSNILVRRVKPLELDVKYVHAKVADFGLSKTKEKSMMMSIQTQNMGSTRWMAP